MMKVDPVRFQQVLDLNQANTPDVGTLDGSGLRQLLEMTDFLKFVDQGNELVAFVLGLLPGHPYESPNYRWFEEHYDSYLYIDRIAVAEKHRSKGIGHELYRLAKDFCQQMGLQHILLEVNTDPPNPGSHLFHQKLGFERVAELQHAPGKSVTMYRLEIS